MGLTDVEVSGMDLVDKIKAIRGREYMFIFIRSSHSKGEASGIKKKQEIEPKKMVQVVLPTI